MKMLPLGSISIYCMFLRQYYYVPTRGEVIAICIEWPGPPVMLRSLQYLSGWPEATDFLHCFLLFGEVKKFTNLFFIGV